MLLTLGTTTKSSAQGPIVPGDSAAGAITLAGETDFWTTVATQGDRIVVQTAEVTGGAGFAPRIEVLAPDGTVMGASTGSTAARLDFQAHVTGAFTIAVSDQNRTGTGTYRLQLVQVPGAFIVPAGDEGGALTNGVNHPGVIDVGDLDLWTFTASPEDRIVLQIGETAGAAAFTPLIELLAPNGARLGAGSGSVAARIEAQAAGGGTYTVLVSDFNQSGAGSYRLRLAQVPGEFVVPAGGDGGALTNGENQTGTIDVGDLDMWTFTATEGDRIVLQLGELTGASGFTPMIELFAPSGARLAADSDGSVARLDAQAAVSGTYTVLVSDFNQSGTGTYQLHLGKVPGAFVVPAGDEGGALADATDQDGAIVPGDFDLWTFAAAPGDRVTLLATELTGGASFTPMIELFAPNGHRQTVAQGAATATLDAAVEIGGTFTVLVSDANQIGSGTYRLRLTRGSIAPPGANVLINGTTHLGTIASVGESNLWTFTASAGENIVVRVGETITGGLLPWLRLSGPTGVLLDSDFNAAAAEVTVRATNSGTFTVAVADGTAARNQTGTYRLSLAKTGTPLAISPSDEGGALTNGASYLASIDNGDFDAWTFTANAGESIAVWMGEVTAGSSLYPWLRFYGPNGALLAADFNASAAEVTVRATNSGRFLVVVGDGNSGYGGTGNYRLSLAKTGSALVISPSDDGGALINGTNYTATIDTGDVDAWTFTANAGESIAVWMGEITSGSTLNPWLRIFGPDGAMLTDDFNASAAEVTVRATNSGTFTVIVNDGNSGRIGNGTYRLSLAKTGGALTIAPADEGGALINGTTYTATIDTGDVDAWAFLANAGENIMVRVGETTAETLDPWIRLFSPNGVLLSDDFNAAAGEVTFRATNSGAFTVIVADGNSGRTGTGNYRLSLARTASALAISPADEGGALANGTTYPATIDTGDLDAWTFTASAGENIVVRMGETIAASPLYPWLRLYGPNGVLLNADFNAAAAEVTFRATNSGTFQVVVGDGNSGLGGSGNYRLSLAKTGSPLAISPSDEGGAMTGAGLYDGMIDTGDIDTWSFTACAGDILSFNVTELVNGSPLYPWLRLYGRDGVLLRNVSGPATAQFTLAAPASGTYTLVASDGNSGLGGAGTYRLTVNGLTDELKLCVPVISGTNANVSGVGGLPGGTFILLTTTNVATPAALWSPIRTNQFSLFGEFTVTNAFNKAQPERFFLLQTP